MNTDFDQPSYTLYLSSNDKVSGTNNNAMFNINWESFLSREYAQYKVSCCFFTSGGVYKDSAGNNFSNCRIVCDLQGHSLSYNSTTNSSSLILGYAKREVQTTTSFIATLSDNPAKTISRPTTNVFSIQIYNAGEQNNAQNQLLVDTDGSGTLEVDMTSWNMVLEFTPIKLASSAVSQQRIH